MMKFFYAHAEGGGSYVRSAKPNLELSNTRFRAQLIWFPSAARCPH